MKMNRGAEMEESAFLLEKYQEFRVRSRKGHEEFYANPSVARIEPFKIAENEALRAHMKQL